MLFLYRPSEGENLCVPAKCTYYTATVYENSGKKARNVLYLSNLSMENSQARQLLPCPLFSFLWYSGLNDGTLPSALFILFWDRLSLCCPGWPWNRNRPSALASEVAGIPSLYCGVSSRSWRCFLWLTGSSSKNASNSSGSRPPAHLPESHQTSVWWRQLFQPLPSLFLHLQPGLSSQQNILHLEHDVSHEQRRLLTLKLFSSACLLRSLLPILWAPLPFIRPHQSALYSLEKCTIACLHSKRDKHANDVRQGLGRSFSHKC